MTDGVTRDDLRAAVASGVLDEAQATKLIALSDQRMGYRANMIGDDEPFELFKGFAEIFVTVGLGLLMSGFIALTLIFGESVFVPIIVLILSVLLALYFTRKRRMTLPSIALCISFAMALSFFLAVFTISETNPGAADFTVLGLLGMVGMGFYFYIFRLPFTMFVVSIYGLLAILGISAMLSSEALVKFNDLTSIFDLREEPAFAVGTLVFGVLAFIGALWFDLKDPHRVSRYGSTAFWLHLAAAPALVNTLVMSNYLMGGLVGNALAIAALIVFTLLAIIIDRRSFLTAGLIYVGLIMSEAISATGAEWSLVLTLLILGGFVTVLGAFWTQIRAQLMGALPSFRGKDRLPPYAAGLAVSE